MQQIVETIYRVFGGLLLLFFAFAPAWILFDLAKTLVLNPGDLDLVAAVAFLICAPLLLFFLLLAYRALTGRGRKQDGGLLPPLALKGIAVAFVAGGLAISAFGLFSGDFRAALGGLGFFVPAFVLYRVVRTRERASSLRVSCPRITTDRLELVPLLSEHADALFPVLKDPLLYEFTHDEPPVSVALLRSRYGLLESRRSPDGTQAWLNWALFERDTGLSVGYVQATVESIDADIAWVVGTRWQRRGYATEAVIALIDWLHNAGVQVVRAKIHPLHAASQRVAVKAGLAVTEEIIDGENLWVRWSE